MKNKRNQNGSIFILVMWVLLFLSVFAFAVGYATRQYLQFIQKLEIRENLREIAEAGVKKAIYILDRKKLQQPVADFLNEDWSQNPKEFQDISLGRGFFAVSYESPVVTKKETGKINEETKAITSENENVRYGVIDEERKLNINKVDKPVAMTKLFREAAEIDEDLAYSIAVSIIDWRDQDEFSYDYGAESQYYKSLSPPYKAKNTDFDTLEELLFVKGVTPEIYSKINLYITIYGNGSINLNTASEYVLKAIGFPDSLVKKVVEFRRGPDQKEGTSDDLAFTELESAVDVLNQTYYLDDIEKGFFKSMIDSGRLQIFSNYFTIQSVAALNGRTEALKVTCVFERHGQIRKWNEQYFSTGD
ncbi:MAG: hypothetical protein A3G33_02895 [Omnitrophica bacterium RIFCSPLOWO2_12_FULL_44_17]|uniref:T2SS protein K first SAM-like domain-containing protein n=1 Tax=Candidatus Danuiimicrobium aquiferis TaxID=1801832 RepID=A0A1G1KVG4_9BACT|nr:MAG: hypothetical protein A3B72_04375 [Omnitrophica bacterium RIFCSPHIGHO2_02_FULL_45_28]OGW96926.1 MAG: hypothetical protein A3G33_02895 [Omnitrophica bacterium RIFCSPLOWO2_12_FULL_44_17]OGX03938.1 MAG: hypothetical protein A3J12_03520 [Omnitrophica bacterium RIFCSPLOWO2_02_FULL_44_11]